MLRPSHTILLSLLALSCGPGTGTQSPAGTISVQWAGASSGSFTAPATARWCAADTLLEVIANRGDTAVGLALLAQESIGAARYPVNATRNWTPGRPQAYAGLRWLGTQELYGYDGFDGTVVVTAGDSLRVTGTLDVGLRLLSDKDTLRLTGQFTKVSIELAPPPCGRAHRPGTG